MKQKQKQKIKQKMFEYLIHCNYTSWTTTKMEEKIYGRIVLEWVNQNKTEIP